MKKCALVTIALVTGMSSYAQIKFEKGYYIDNNNQRVECLIKNQDWEHNPDSFLFKYTENETPQMASLLSVSEFGIGNEFKYVRATTDVDQSSDNIQELSTKRNPEFIRQQLFLKVLVEGKATLLEYKGPVLLFFFKTDSVPVKPLIYKIYKSTGSNVAKNMTFRQQLLSTMRCGTSLATQSETLVYKKKDLIKFFIDYNNCMNPGTIEPSAVLKENSAIFHLWLRPRVTFSSALMRRSTIVNTYEDISLEKIAKISGGVEAEIILPFNNNSWAIIIEPTYQSYYSSIMSKTFAQNPPRPVKIDYTALEIPIGIRHYFFVSTDSKISLSTALQLNFSGNSTWSYSTIESRKISSTPGFNQAFELGFVFKNKFCLSYRYQTARKLIFTDPSNLSTRFNTMAFVAGYSIF